MAIAIALIAAVLAALFATNVVAFDWGDPAGDTAQVVFLLFLLALIVAALRAILRPPHA